MSKTEQQKRQSSPTFYLQSCCDGLKKMENQTSLQNLIKENQSNVVAKMVL